MKGLVCFDSQIKSVFFGLSLWFSGGLIDIDTSILCILLYSYFALQRSSLLFYYCPILVYHSFGAEAFSIRLVQR
jgi:hypothetical protein